MKEKKLQLRNSTTGGKAGHSPIKGRSVIFLISSKHDTLHLI